jgi:hypothetical protein
LGSDGDGADSDFEEGEVIVPACEWFVHNDGLLGDVGAFWVAQLCLHVVVFLWRLETAWRLVQNMGIAG